MLHNNQSVPTTATAHGTEPTIAAIATNVTNATATHFATTAETANTNETVVAIVSDLSAVVEAPAAATTTASAATTADVPVPPTTDNSTSFGIQMRAQQRQKIKSYHDAKQTAVWRTDSLASNPNSAMMTMISPSDPGSISLTSGSMQATPPVIATTVATPFPMKGIILSSSSLMQRKSSDSSLTASIPRRVSFPDNELVTGYLEPANPWRQACQARSTTEILDQYVQSCSKHHTTPLNNILDHLKSLDLHKTRQNLLSLKGVQLKPNDCEAIEELFKSLQYKVIDLSECPLDESCLSALCQMIEYYEAANELDISYNKEAMTKRSWDSCAYMVERSQQLQLLNAEGNPITMQGAEYLGRGLRSSYLHTLKLEHCGLRGTPLVKLCTGLYHNKMLKELWMGYNDLDCVDAQHIADTLRFNHSIELIDISNNNIRDEGAKYLVQALIRQSGELERRLGALKRARAIEMDDSCGSPTIESETTDSSLKTTTLSAIPSVPEQNSPPIDEINNGAITEINVTSMITPKEETLSTTNTIPPANSQGIGVLIDLDTDSNDPDDDNTEDTVRTIKNSTQNSSGGQSMLDKLLSMNSDSSGSDEAHSNISTDTLPACGSEDISEISNEIFQTDAKDLTAITTTTTSTTTTTDTGIITNSNSSSDSTAPQPEETEPTIAVTESLTGVPQPDDSPKLELSPKQQQLQQQSSQNERNLCDIITPSTEAKPVEPNETCVQNNNHNSNNNANNNYNNNTIQVDEAGIVPEASPSVVSNSSSIFEVTAEESDCINGGTNGVVSGASSRPLDVNKNANVAADDFEDTHSTDSAFESASEGDISRHLPDEFSRLSVLLDSTRLDDNLSKEMAIETATIASESTECLLVAQEAATVTPSSTPTPKDEATFLAPKVTIAEECLIKEKDETSPSPRPSPTLTPPPPSTSPGGVGIGLRRTESSCAYLNQSTRNRSQSSDSLSSDTSLDGIPGSSNIAEKLTKNDTLSRRQLADANLEAAQRSPSGLKALTLWNNNLTKNCAENIAELLEKTISLELLNIGKNCLSNEFISIIKDSLTTNQTLTTLGLQSAHLSAKGIETLSSILSFGGNSKLQRIDIRDNKLEVESLNIIAEVLKSNKTLTQIDINDEPKRLTLPIVPIVNVIPPTPLPQESIGSDAHLDYTRVLGTVRSLCSRNEKMQTQELAEKTTANVGSLRNNRSRVGYYLGSRKISLTCHSRPLVDARTGTVTATAAVTTANQLEVKRKATAATVTSSRLRSPGPSPPTISPSSSPSRSRFQVSRVTEVGGLPGSSLAQLPPASSCMSIPTISSPGSVGGALGAGSLPTSSSLPAMATVSSSTQTVKRLSVSPRSRFHVSRIYEDPKVPVGSRQLPPITPHTPPLDLPPTPMLKSARKAIQASQISEMEMSKPMTSTTSVVIVEPPIEDAQQINSTNAQEESVSAMGGSKLSPTTTNSSSSSSTSPISGSDITDSSSTSSFTSSSSPSYTISKPCPLAVFGDNDITLTKESASVVALSINPEPATTQPSTITIEQQQQQQQQQQPARARKTSWIANPSAVDKLLTLFNTGTIFQRSSSPESKTNNPVQITPAAVTNNAQNTTNNANVGNVGIDGQNQIQNSPASVTRKTTPPSIWSCNSNSTLVHGELGTGAASSTSFLESASRQFRDFGKQVFRQNLSFNNSCDVAAGAVLSTNSNTDGNTLSSNMATAGTISSSSSSSTSADMSSPSVLSQECNTVHMPSSLKRELKENISPEHTINEETLHTLQKFSRMEDVTAEAAAATAVATAAEDAAELGDIEIVMHSEVVDCMPVTDQQQQQHQQQPHQQQQQEDLAAPQTTV